MLFHSLGCSPSISLALSCVNVSLLFDLQCQFDDLEDGPPNKDPPACRVKLLHVLNIDRDRDRGRDPESNVAVSGGELPCLVSFLE